MQLQLISAISFCYQKNEVQWFTWLFFFFDSTKLAHMVFFVFQTAISTSAPRNFWSPQNKTSYFRLVDTFIYFNKVERYIHHPWRLER